MSTLANDRDRSVLAKKPPPILEPKGGAPPSKALQIAGIAARSIFILAVITVMARVSMPQTMGSIGQAGTSLADIARFALGAAGCLFMARQLFVFRRGAHDHKLWLILGPTLTALLVICAVAWW